MQSSQSVSGGYELFVSQNGSALPCGNEFDIFLAPTDSAYDATPVRTQNLGSNIPPLSLLSGLTASFTLQLLSASTTARCGPPDSCGPSGHLDYAYVTLGLVLSNPIEGQTLFYQVIVYDTRGPPSCPSQDPCQPFAYWFFEELPTLGFSESIANSYSPAEGACLVPGAEQPQAFSLPIYDRLTWAVATAADKYGSSSNTSHWDVTGVYLGPGMEGSVALQISISNVDLFIAS